MQKNNGLTPAQPSWTVLSGAVTMSWGRSLGSWCSDSISLARVEAKMNNPDDFFISADPRRIATGRSDRSRSSVSPPPSVSPPGTVGYLGQRSKVQLRATGIPGRTAPGAKKQNPVRMRGSGLPVMTNSAIPSVLGRLVRKPPSVEAGRSHSSRVSTTMMHKSFVEESRSTTKSSS